MAKRGGFPGGMPGNMNNLMKQAQKMQKQMEENQRALEEKEFTATAGGGVVDLIVAATNEALRMVEEASGAALSKLTGGLGGLGGGFPF